ncbi:MAG: ThuA domain-containing protein [Methanobacteriota archaeon]|nr:MAG: ThuA domain-containing protein [Euryarchaeota archaeon]
MCIVIAMVLGAFAGLTYAQSGSVGASSAAGTRGEDRHLVSAYDVAQKALPNKAAESLAAAHDKPATQAVASGKSPGLIGAGNRDVARLVTSQDAKQMMVTPHRVQTKDGAITVAPAASTRGAFPPGTIIAGGPYVGTEGDKVTDGIVDYPNQTAAPALGRWTTLSSVTWVFLHPYFGSVMVRGWDGVSMIVQINTGDNMGEATTVYALLYPMNRGYRFSAKQDMRATGFGQYNWYTFEGYSVRIWDWNTHALLGTCTPDQITFQWNWCTLSSPIRLTLGGDYIISEHKSTPSDPFNPPFFAATQAPSDTAQVHFNGGYYTLSPADSFPETPSGNPYIPLIDFKWEITTFIPDPATATASLYIQNLAPVVSGVTSNPNPGREGTPTSFLADFSDPGLNETWQYRWKFFYPPIGWQTGPWQTVQKYNGGARVLLLHTWSDNIGEIQNRITSTCGNFCVTIDTWDFGPLGVDKVPSLDYVEKYNVVVVGTNYFNSHMGEIGDLLADYEDNGGGVVALQAGFDNSFGDLAGIAGRWESDMYSPIPRGPADFGSASLGTIYDPGHPLLDGVSSMSGALRADTFDTNPGADRVVDWTDGTVLGATQLNPVVNNGARAVALNIFPYSGWSSGDYMRMIANAIRWASRQPDPTVKSMPITLDPYRFTFPDDVPTTTPQDDYPVTVEVKDDSEGTVAVTDQSNLYFQNFESPAECNGAYYFTNTFPPGWDSNPNPFGWVCDSTFGSRGPNIWFYYNDPLYGTGDGVSNLVTPSFDTSSFVALRYSAYHDWAGDYPTGGSTGYIEASIDGGATYPIELHRFAHNNPARFQGQVTIDSFDLGGQSDVRIRYRYMSNDDWWWYFDNVQITGINGFVWHGLGSADGVITIANVPPTVIGGFNSVVRDEAQSVLFKGFKLSDPALSEPTEWFAYRFNFDDGTPTDWVYKGSLAPPKFTVLIVNTICLGPIDTTCGDQEALKSTLLSLDDVASVDTFNFINYPFLPTAPDLDTMLQYDVIIVATNWAYFSYAPFDLARRQVGDRLADYVDSGRGGVLTMMCVYCLAGGNDLFSIRGRYINDQYGAFKRANYLFPGASAIDILEPDHEAFVNVGTDVGSMFIHDGKDPITIGGNNAAAGTDGQLLANWDDGTTAVGVKELNTGARTAHFGGFAHPTGSDTPMLLRNLIGWSHGGLPSPKVPTFDHTWGDNGIYTVDIEAIDDDMGWVWDDAANAPLQALPDASLAHKFVTVTVNNVDPKIDRSSIEAFIATQSCVRVAGTAGNSVTLDLYQDGNLLSTTTTTRASGDPNPNTEKCGLFKIDVLGPAHTYSATVTYDAPMGGSNPSWVVFSPWREPVTPGHGTVTVPLDTSREGTSNLDVAGLKQDLLDSGRGARIDFSAEARDPGTDDLAFVWSWGGESNVVYNPARADSDYTINVHHDDGTATSSGTLGPLTLLGFSEPLFDRASNTGRSPIGAMNLVVRDSATHAFGGGQSTYYVFLIVLDDDNSRGYDSHFAPTDGVDIQIIVLNLA